MSNASTQPGFLVPVDEPLQDDALVDAIQATVVGVVEAGKAAMAGTVCRGFMSALSLQI